MINEISKITTVPLKLIKVIEEFQIQLLYSEGDFIEQNFKEIEEVFNSIQI